jgi:hypothetical protein
MKPREKPSAASSRPRPPNEDRLRRYEELLADSWTKAGASLNDLLKHRDNPFGCRALAHYCLKHDELPDGTEGIAHRLEDMEQKFRLAIDLFERLQKDGSLTEWGLQKYAFQRRFAAANRVSADQGRNWLQGRVRGLQARDWIGDEHYGFRRPILFPSNSVNQTVPSRPTTIPSASLP